MKIEQKEQKGGFLNMALGTLDTNLLGHLLTGKEMKTKKPGWRIIKAGEGTTRTGQDFSCSLIL